MLLHEFAIDPDIFIDWCTFRYFIDQCGVHHGRLISRFPSSHWERLVNESCNRNFTVMERHSLVERLAQLKSKLVKSRRDYNPDNSWVENVKLQFDNHRPFRAVIELTQPVDDDRFLIAETVHEKTKHWAVPREIRIQRQADKMAECVSLLFQVSKRILLVEPHFKPKRNGNPKTGFVYKNDIPDRFKTSLRAFIEEAKKQNKSKIEYHICFDIYDEENKGRIEEIFRDELIKIVPSDFEFNLVIWKEGSSGKAFHARYVLTNAGGMRFEHGLDEGKKGQQTDVSLLDPVVHEEALNDIDLEKYEEDPTSMPFELIGKITVSTKSAHRYKVVWYNQ